MPELFKTPLHAWHESHGAKMAPFAGWDMPIQYEGIIQEHTHTRTQAAVFDICHMGQFLISGPGAALALAKAASHNLDTLKTGKCRYGFLLNPQGGVIDDLIIYRLDEEKFLAVVNAARVDTDFAAFTERVSGPGIVVKNITPQKGKIDLQGPAALEALEHVLGADYHDLAYFSFRETAVNGDPMLVSRTGYTGELGYELYPSRSQTLALWEALLAHPKVKPAGLGARDTLRLEAGLALYGHELDEAHTPAEAGMGAMLTSAAPYVGHEHAKAIRNALLVPLSLEGRRTARNGDQVVLPGGGDPIGTVTSGSFAPTLGYAVAFAYINTDHAGDAEFGIQSGRNILPARKTGLPFYKEGTARIKL